MLQGYMPVVVDVRFHVWQHSEMHIVTDLFDDKATHGMHYKHDGALARQRS